MVVGLLQGPVERGSVLNACRPIVLQLSIHAVAAIAVVSV